MRSLLLISALIGILHAQTEISGTISGTWTPFGSPYRIVGDALVGVDDSLSVRPQVSIEFMGSYRMTIGGRLEMLGAQIRGPGEIFGDAGSLRIQDCSFDSLDAAVQCFGGNLLLCQNTMRNTGGTAVSVQAADSARICSNSIEASGDYGIKVSATDNVFVAHNTLRSNSTNDLNHPALFIDSCSPQEVFDNRIIDNHAQGVGVWALTAPAFPWIRGNLISGNYTGITIVNASPVIEDNLILGNLDPGNFNSGAGIYVGYAEAHPLVNRNCIAGNYYGVSIINDAYPTLGDMVNDWPGDDGENLFYDNIFDGVLTNIWNATSNPIMAQNNYWLEIDTSRVDSTIFDDDEGVGAGVSWWPIYVTYPLAGDLTADAELDIRDVVLLIETILDPDLPGALLFYRADLNGDLQISIMDATALITAILEA